MGTALVFLLAIGLVLLVFVLLAILYALIIPADISIRYDRSCRNHTTSWRVIWGFFQIQSETAGMGKYRICMFGRYFLLTGGSTERKSDRVAGLTGTDASFDRVRAIAPVIPDVIGILRNALRIRRCSCTFTFGLGSVAGTGRLYGWLSAIRGMLYSFPGLDVTFTPVFDRQMFDLELTLVFRLYRPLLTGIRLYRVMRKISGNSVAGYSPPTRVGDQPWV